MTKESSGYRGFKALLEEMEAAVRATGGSPPPAVEDEEHPELDARLAMAEALGEEESARQNTLLIVRAAEAQLKMAEAQVKLRAHYFDLAEAERDAKQVALDTAMVAVDQMPDDEVKDLSIELLEKEEACLIAMERWTASMAQERTRADPNPTPKPNPNPSPYRYLIPGPARGGGPRRSRQGLCFSHRQDEPHARRPRHGQSCPGGAKPRLKGVRIHGVLGGCRC